MQSRQRRESAGQRISEVNNVKLVVRCRFNKNPKRIPGKGGSRYWKNVGLGFKTPKDAVEGEFSKLLQPAAGGLGWRGEGIEVPQHADGPAAHVVTWSTGLELHAGAALPPRP